MSTYSVYLLTPFDVQLHQSGNNWRPQTSTRATWFTLSTLCSSAMPVSCYGKIPLKVADSHHEPDHHHNQVGCCQSDIPPLVKIHLNLSTTFLSFLLTDKTNSQRQKHNLLKMNSEEGMDFYGLLDISSTSLSLCIGAHCGALAHCQFKYCISNKY